jgi:uncharacterized protein (TIGR02147 family)
MLVEHMKRTFAERCRKNSSYSLRAFARSLGMDSSSVSAILKGKRPLTIKSARKIVEGLNITNPVEAQALIMNTFTPAENETLSDYTEIAMESAEAISSWQHFAILAVLELKDFKGQERQIAERLNIPFGIASECLGRLEKLGLIEKKKDLWKLTGKNMATPSHIPSAALREGHRQFIHKALHSLESDPVEMREISGITMAISKTRLTEAKSMIKDFRRRLSTYLESGGLDAVYRLNIQLFPLSQEKKQ